MTSGYRVWAWNWAFPCGLEDFDKPMTNAASFLLWLGNAFKIFWGTARIDNPKVIKVIAECHKWRSFFWATRCRQKRVNCEPCLVEKRLRPPKNPRHRTVRKSPYLALGSHFHAAVSTKSLIRQSLITAVPLLSMPANSNHCPHSGRCPANHWTTRRLPVVLPTSCCWPPQPFSPCRGYDQYRQSRGFPDAGAFILLVGLGSFVVLVDVPPENGWQRHCHLFWRGGGTGECLRPVGTDRLRLEREPLPWPPLLMGARLGILFYPPCPSCWPQRWFSDCLTWNSPGVPKAVVRWWRTCFDRCQVAKFLQSGW